jgi:predicted nucleic acid-binding protein
MRGADSRSRLGPITALALFTYPQIAEDEAARIELLLRSTVIIPVDSRVARITGAVRRQYRLKTADSAVAGPALLTHTTLVTRNVRDFQHVQTLSLLPV